MEYQIVIKRTAQKKLQGLPRNERNRIAEKISCLGLNPDDKQLDIKLLEGIEGYYRLRVGNWRIIFMRDDIIQLISIEKIKPRGDAYK